MSGEHCQACGKQYETVYYLSDDVWERIKPENEPTTHGDFGAGLLCPTCADQRARQKGIFLYWEANAGDWRVK